LYSQRDYKARKERVRQALAQAKSKIHVGFDLWTSPASVDCVAEELLTLKFEVRKALELSLFWPFQLVEQSN
jgi:hypothetical protein